MTRYMPDPNERHCHPDINAVDEVRLAALKLDRLKPGWHLCVDPIALNLSDPCRCVCGQNGLAYDAVFVDKPGMDVTLWRVFEPLWLNEIAERLPAAVDVPDLPLAHPSPRGHTETGDQPEQTGRLHEFVDEVTPGFVERVELLLEGRHAAIVAASADE